MGTRNEMSRLRICKGIWNFNFRIRLPFGKRQNAGTCSDSKQLLTVKSKIAQIQTLWYTFRHENHRNTTCPAIKCATKLFYAHKQTSPKVIAGAKTIVHWSSCMNMQYSWRRYMRVVYMFAFFVSTARFCSFIVETLSKRTLLSCILLLFDVRNKFVILLLAVFAIPTIRFFVHTLGFLHVFSKLSLKWLSMPLVFVPFITLMGRIDK